MKLSESKALPPGHSGPDRLSPGSWTTLLLRKDGGSRQSALIRPGWRPYFASGGLTAETKAEVFWEMRSHSVFREVSTVTQG